uniref:Heat shock 70 kDa protein 12A-like n=1 Tax=Callorhinchus milii TaxID=7868 RepID=A0A4W3JQ00_CALMI
MRRWEGGDPGVSNQKTPTTILLTPEGTYHSFGYAARDFYHDLDPNDSKQWLYFEKFKMKLHTSSVSCYLIASSLPSPLFPPLLSSPLLPSPLSPPLSSPPLSSPLSLPLPSPPLSSPLLSSPLPPPLPLPLPLLPSPPLSSPLLSAPRFSPLSFPFLSKGCQRAERKNVSIVGHTQRSLFKCKIPCLVPCGRALRVVS